MVDDKEIKKPGEISTETKTPSELSDAQLEKAVGGGFGHMPVAPPTPPSPGVPGGPQAGNPSTGG
jgi:hypothetical protein